MAVYANQITVGTTPVPVTVPEQDQVPGARWNLRNPGLTNPIYLGGPNVTPTSGLVLPAGQDIDMATWPGDLLYAVAAVAAQQLHVLGTGV